MLAFSLLMRPVPFQLPLKIVQTHRDMLVGDEYSAERCFVGSDGGEARQFTNVTFHTEENIFPVVTNTSTLHIFQS